MIPEWKLIKVDGAVLERAKKDVQIEFNGYGNGHSEYMVVDVDRDEFLEYIAKVSLGLLSEWDHEPVAGVKFEAGNNGVTVAYFSACEKYTPQFNPLIKSAFPKAIVYGFGAWDSCYVEAPEGTYTATLEECFEDAGNLRIDVRITDKLSGCYGMVGDLICFDSTDDVDMAEVDESFSYLNSLLNLNDQADVDRYLNDCWNYWYDENDEAE